MPFRTPKYRLHKGSGQALVQIKGERIYLGKYGSEESKDQYRRLVAEFFAGGNKPDKRAETPFHPAAQITVNGLILAQVTELWESIC
jgi:hypothetical protein